jgi:pimeloyl-ACP methyl ester carboxylesterase
MSTRSRFVRPLSTLGVLVAAALLASGAHASAPIPLTRRDPALAANTRIWTIHYRAWDGRRRRAFVLLPAWYGPHDHPAIPLVISPHGRGQQAIDNSRFWGNLPGDDRFAVVNPEGQGRKLTLYSWGDPGEISDLARMPEIVRHALPWLRISQRRIYAVGGSMGGQESMLLVAEHPHLLAGAISFDADTNLALRYRDFELVPDEHRLRRVADEEVGGTPSTDLAAYETRSPIDHVRQIAFSHVPLAIWWSTKDRVVIDQARNSQALLDRIRRLDPQAPVRAVVGTWGHTDEMWYFRRLPAALASIGVIQLRDGHPLPRLGRLRVTPPLLSPAPLLPSRPRP